MVIGNLNRQILRAGASVLAVMLLTTTVFAQDSGGNAGAIEPVFYGIAVGEPDPNDGVPDIVIDDGAFVPGDPGDDDAGADDGSDPGGDDSVDGGDDVADDDGMVWAGGNPNFCEACGGEVILDIPVAVLQMSSGSVLSDQPAEVAAKPRTSSARPTLTNRVATCLDLHPQIPWLCE